MLPMDLRQKIETFAACKITGRFRTRMREKVRSLPLNLLRRHRSQTRSQAQICQLARQRLPHAVAVSFPLQRLGAKQGSNVLSTIRTTPHTSWLRLLVHLRNHLLLHLRMRLLLALRNLFEPICRYFSCIFECISETPL